MTHRFFVSPGSILGERVLFPNETSHQIRRVLRLRAGEKVIVLDHSGKEYEVLLSSVGEAGVEGNILSAHACIAEPRSSLTLYLCLTQREKYEWMLQKCTEVGASRFVPVISSRSLVQKTNEVQSKQERWERILQEAAEQCGRGTVPVLLPAVDFQGALAAAKSNSLRLIPWEGEHTLSLSQALEISMRSERADVAILIGPEGGFSETEVRQAIASGFYSVTLGPRILRMETAAIVSTALVLHLLGEME
jgi:16S rRNA (uracil1498-N3)-methyltransferase